MMIMIYKIRRIIYKRVKCTLQMIYTNILIFQLKSSNQQYRMILRYRFLTLKIVVASFNLMIKTQNMMLKSNSIRFSLG